MFLPLAVLLLVSGSGAAPTGVSGGPAPGGPALVQRTTFAQDQPSPTLESGPVTTAPVPLQLILLVASDGPAAGRQRFSEVTGCGLGWHLVDRANGRRGTAEVWAATAPTGVSGCAPKATRAVGAFRGASALYAFNRALVRNSSSKSSDKGAAAVVLPVAEGAYALGVGNDPDDDVRPTVMAGQQLAQAYRSPLGSTMWVQQASPANVDRTLQIGTTAPADHEWNFVAAEVVRATRPAPGGAQAGVAPAPAPVPRTGRPGPGTTGVPAGTALVRSAGRTVRTANQVIDAQDITGQVTIAAPGVVIKNSRIHGTDAFGVYVRSGSVKIYDSEIFGFANAIAFDNWAAYRVDIHSTTEDGVKLGSDVNLEDSWIHDLTPGEGAHADGAQMQGGVRDLVVRHNVISSYNPSTGSRGNSAIFLAPDLGPSTNGPVTIADNWLDGGNFTLYVVDGNNGEYVVNNISVIGNRFGRNFEYGPVRATGPVRESGNVWADTLTRFAF